MNTCQVDGLVVHLTQTTTSALDHPGHQTWQCVISSCGISSRTMFTSHNFQRHYQNCDSASTPQSGTSHETCLGGFGGNGSIAWTSAVSHEGRTSNAFNPLKPNDPYSGRTAPLTSKRCILYIYSTYIGTEYFKHDIYSPFFPLQNAVCFITLKY